MERDRFEPMEGFENKDRGTLWWRTSHRSDTHLQILRVQCPPNGSILNAVLWVKLSPEQCFHCVSMLLDWMVCSCHSHHASESAVRIHMYTRCLSHTRVATHMRSGAVWRREKYIYLKTVSQLSKFVQSVLFTSIHSIRLWAQSFLRKRS